MTNITGLKRDIVNYLHKRYAGYPTIAELFNEMWVTAPVLVAALSSLIEDGIIEHKDFKIKLL